MNFGNGEISTSNENKVIKSQEDKKNYEYLLFFDSRGLTTDELDYQDTILNNLIELFKKKNITYIAISRPKNLTIFATLLNFLKLNSELKFKNLITNLGFVDLTPKKQSNIDDMLYQINQFYHFDGKIIEKENYELSGGGTESMKVLDYSTEYILYTNSILIEKFEKIFLINTPIISENIKIDRIRPKSFFKQLKKTNELIEKILILDKKYELIDIKSINKTFDAVHFNRYGHKDVFNLIKNKID